MDNRRGQFFGLYLVFITLFLSGFFLGMFVYTFISFTESFQGSTLHQRLTGNKIIIILHSNTRTKVFVKTIIAILGLTTIYKIISEGFIDSEYNDDLPGYIIDYLVGTQFDERIFVALSFTIGSVFAWKSNDFLIKGVPNDFVIYPYLFSSMSLYFTLSLVFTLMKNRFRS